MHTAIKQRLTKLDAQEERLLDLLADGSLPTSKVRSRLQKLQQDRAPLQAEKGTADERLAIGAHGLRTALAPMATPHRIYLHSPDTIRRTVNDALYDAFYLDEHGYVAETRMEPAFQQMVDAYGPYRQKHFTNSKSLDPKAEALSKS